MTAVNRETSIELLLREEGGGLQRLHGRSTCWGIDLTALSLAQLEIGVLEDELSRLDREAARDILSDTWARHRLDFVPLGLDYFLLDCGIVCGFPCTVRWVASSLQLNDTYPDSEKVVELLRELGPFRTSLLISQVTFSRRRRHKTEPGWFKYSQIKTNRVNRVQHRALKMCGTGVQPKEELTNEAGSERQSRHEPSGAMEAAGRAGEGVHGEDQTESKRA